MSHTSTTGRRVFHASPQLGLACALQCERQPSASGWNLVTRWAREESQQQLSGCNHGARSPRMCAGPRRLPPVAQPESTGSRPLSGHGGANFQPSPARYRAEFHRVSLWAWPSPTSDGLLGPMFARTPHTPTCCSDGFPREQPFSSLRSASAQRRLYLRQEIFRPQFARHARVTLRPREWHSG
jgi:hypothetical protein